MRAMPGYPTMLGYMAMLRKSLGSLPVVLLAFSNDTSSVMTDYKELDTRLWRPKTNNHYKQLNNN